MVLHITTYKNVMKIKKTIVKENHEWDDFNQFEDKDEYIFETIDDPPEESTRIPDSEWKKVFGYIDQGSDFKKVGAACKRNSDKLKSRYVILKALGLNDAARDFLKGADISWMDDAMDKLPIPEVPTKYADKVADKDQLSKDYSKQQAKFAKRSMAGPLKELAQMGIEFFTLYPDGSGKRENKQKAMDILGFIPKWRPASTGLETRNGRRWDVQKSVIMVNGETIKGDRWFEFVDHTNEGIDSPSYGYDVGFAGDWRVGASEVGSNTVREWIRDNVKLTETDDSITLSESTKVTLSIGQIKKLVKEFYGTEDYYNDLINQREEDNLRYERWAENRFDVDQPDAKKVFWDENIGDCESLKDKITDVFKNAPKLKYELWWDDSGDPFAVFYTIITPDGKEFYADVDSILPSDFVISGKAWIEKDKECRRILSPYFKNGSADIEKLITDISNFESEVNGKWDDTPKTSDEYDPDWDSGDDDDYREDY